MTKTKKAVKKLNKQADKAIRKAKKEQFRAQLSAFLDKEVKGIKNWHLVATLASLLIIIELF